MYQAMEESKGELARTNDLVLNLRAEIKDMQKVRKTFEATNAVIADLEKQVTMLEEKLIFPLLCKSCGKPLRADFRICPYCGLEINIRQEPGVCEPSFSARR
jgi:rRNA maturation endonuclease Nob1